MTLFVTSRTAPEITEIAANRTIVWMPVLKARGLETCAKLSGLMMGIATLSVHSVIVEMMLEIAQKA